jgi:hypothetical protein
MKNRGEILWAVSQAWSKPTIEQPEPILTTSVRDIVAGRAALEMRQEERDWILKNAPEYMSKDYLPEPNISSFEAWSMGVKNWSYFGGAIKAMTDVDAPANTYDDVETRTYNPLPSIDANPDWKREWDRAKRDLDNPFNRALFENIRDANNDRYLAYAFQRRAEQEEYMQQVEDAGMTAYAIGAITGLGVDTVLAILASRGLGAGAAVTRSVAGARTLGAARAGSVFAAEGALDATLQSLTNDYMTGEDIMIAGGAGGAIGGVLGAALPKFVGGVYSKQGIQRGIERTAEVYDDMMDAAKRVDDAGAMRVKEEPGIETPKVADIEEVPMELSSEVTVIGHDKAFNTKVRQAMVDKDWFQHTLGRLPGAGRLLGALRSARGGSRAFIERARAGRAAGEEGMPFVGSILERIYRFSGLVGEDLMGRARPSDFSTDFRVLQEKLYAVERRTGKEFNQLLLDTYGKKGMLNAAGRAMNHDYLGHSIVQGIDGVRGKISSPAHVDASKEITHAEWMAEADIYAQAIGEGDDIAAGEIVRNLMARFPEGTDDVVEAALQREAKLWNEFYEDFGRAEVQYGLLDAADLKPGYRPQVWNAEAIRTNHAVFKNMLRQLLMQEPDPIFAMAMMIDEGAFLTGRAQPQPAPKLADPADPYSAPRQEVVEDDTGFVPWDPEAETWAEFYAREPVVAEEIAKEWDKVRRMDAEERLELARNKLEKEMKNFSENSAEEVFVAKQEMINKKLESIEHHERVIANASKDIEPTRNRTLDGDVVEPSLFPADQRRIEKAELANERVKKALRQIWGRRKEIEAIENSTKDLEAAYIESKMAEASIDGRWDEAVYAPDGLVSQMTKKRKERTPKGIPEADAKKLRKFQERIARKETQIAMLKAKRLFDEELDRMIAAMSDNRAYGGFLDTEASHLLQSSRFFKRRALDLRGLRHKPEWRKFLRTDSLQHAAAYSESAGRQILLRKHFVPWLRREGYIEPGEITVQGMADFEAKHGGIEKVLMKVFTEKFNKDRAKYANDPKKLKEINDLHGQAKASLERAFEHITRRDRMKYLDDEGMMSAQAFMTGLQSAAASMTLGFVMLSSLGDLATAIAAGPRTQGPIKLFMRRSKPFIKELDNAGAWELASLITGGNVENMGRFNRLLDIDEVAGFDVPGGMWERWRLTTQSVAQLEGYANFMHIWNKFIRRQFGVHFARMFADDIDDWAGKVQSKAPIRWWYAAKGLTEKEAGVLKTLLDRHHIIIDGKRYPDIPAWRKAGKHQEIEWYKRAVSGAGDEAMMDPGIGDRPYLARSMVGRLALQFTSFAYTIGNQWLTPLIQRMLINPADAGKTVASFSTAMSLAVVGEMARDIRRGEDPAAKEDFVWRSIMRSPFMIGVVGPAFDIGSPLFAANVNRFIGADVFTREAQRFRMSGGFAGALGGPALGAASGAYQAIADMSKGDVDSMENFLKYRLPLLNTILPWSILALLNEQ